MCWSIYWLLTCALLQCSQKTEQPTLWEKKKSENGKTARATGLTRGTTQTETRKWENETQWLTRHDDTTPLRQTTFISHVLSDCNLETSWHNDMQLLKLFYSIYDAIILGIIHAFSTKLNMLNLIWSVISCRVFEVMFIMQTSYNHHSIQFHINR